MNYELQNNDEINMINMKKTMLNHTNNDPNPLNLMNKNFKINNKNDNKDKKLYEDSIPKKRLWSESGNINTGFNTINQLEMSNRLKQKKQEDNL